MRLSVRVFPNSFSPPPQSIRYFYSYRHHILCRSRESVCPSSYRFVRFPRATLTLLTAAPLSLSVLVGRGGRLVLLHGPPHRPLTPPPCCLYMSWLGGLLLIPRTPHAPLKFLSLFVLVGRDGFDQPPLAHPNSTVVSVLPAKSYSLCGFQTKCPL